MKKAISMFLAGTIALGAVSCKKDANNPEPQKGKTAMRVVAYEGNGSLRATDMNQTDAAGQGSESKVANGLFITLEASKNANFTQLSPAVPSLEDNQEAMFQTAPFEYTGTIGNDIQAFLVLNPNDLVTDDIRKTFAKTGEHEITIASLENLTKSEGFTMTSASKNVDIKANVKENALTNANTGDNIFSFDVERVTSKLQVALKKEGFTASNVTSKYGANGITDLRYSLAGSATKAYLFADHAGKRVMSADISGKAYNTYKDFTSLIHNIKGDARKDVLTKVSNDTDANVVATPDLDAKLHSLQLTAIDNDANLKTSRTEGIYFLENSIDIDVTAENQLMYKDIAYVKVYGKLSFPNTSDATAVMKLNDQNKLVQATGQEVNANNNGTFYKGQDGILYLAPDAAKANGNKVFRKFTEGKMYWRFPVNNVVVGDLTKYADTRRNNIYSLLIESITNIGDNWDPVDPSDPNIPKPEDNPNEPTKDPNDPVNPAKTYVKVKATILKWNVVSRGVDLN